MKPRIVRERYTAETFPPSLHEAFVGEPWLALKWPKVGTGPGECPYTPEQVMAALEQHGLGLDSIAKPNLDGVWWVRVVSSLGHSGWTENLTPEFIGEPKRCPLCGEDDKWKPRPTCLALKNERLCNDRRHEMRRKGERRMICSDRDWHSGRRRPSDRRGFSDRRRAK